MNDLTENAIIALLSGYRAEAIQLLYRAVVSNPHDLEAWYWLALSYPDRKNRLACLRELVDFNPDNKIVPKVFVRFGEPFSSKLNTPPANQVSVYSEYDRPSLITLANGERSTEIQPYQPFWKDPTYV